MKRHLFFDREKLISDLKVARMNVYYKDFARNCLKAALIMNVILNLALFFLFSKIAEKSKKESILLFLLLTLPLGFYILFEFMIKTPQARAIRSRKNIEAEIISAIRFLILDLKANAPIYHAIQNLTKNFDETGKYFNDVIAKVQLGSSLENALTEEVEVVPCEDFRVLLWQMISHLQTGADIVSSLETIVKDISEKQRLEFKKYGKKLNALSIFYMIIAIILPTIGFTLVTAALIFIGVPINESFLYIVLGFWMIFSIMQLLFLSMSGANRPVIES
jgi:Flp pilus assembly protein TadB